MYYHKIKPMKIKVTYRTLQKTVENLLRLYLDSISITRSFKNQAELITALNLFLQANNMVIPNTITQPNISRALKTIKFTSFPKRTGPYMFIKAKGKYRFVPLETRLIPLFKLQNTFHKNSSVFIMSDNTIMFKINKSSHQAFIEILEKNFSDDTLWGYESLENHLMLMFNTTTKRQRNNCDILKKFFVLKEAFESKIVYKYEF